MSRIEISKIRRRLPSFIHIINVPRLETKKSRELGKYIQGKPPQHHELPLKQRLLKMEPDARPKLGKIEEVVRNLIAITCEGQDYDYIIPSDLVERLNSAIHKAIKPLVPKRYRFTTQSFLFTRDGQVHIT